MADYSVTFQASGTVDTTRQPSGALWADCNWLDLVRGEKAGCWFHDNFVSMPLIGTQTTQIGYDKYKVFATSGNAVTPSSAVNSVDLGGGILAFTHGSSGESASLAQAYPAFKITGDPSTSNKLWFECRIAVKSVLTLRNAFLVGLAETNLFTLATLVPLTTSVTAGTITNAGSFVGFHRLSAGTSIIDTAYTDRAATFTNLNSTAGEVTMAAFTFTKLGIKYDPADKNGRNIRFFQDNVELATAMTNAQITATTNLKANSLGFMIASLAGSSVSTDAVYLDDVRMAQYYPGQF